MLVEIHTYRSMHVVPKGWIGEPLGIDRATEDRCIGKMIAAGILERSKGKLVTRASVTVWTGADPTRVRSIKRHWTEVGRARLADPGADDLFTYSVMSLSNDDYQRAKRILEGAFREIQSVVSASAPEEVAALLQVQLLRWGPADD